VTHQRPNRN